MAALATICAPAGLALRATDVVLRCCGHYHAISAIDWQLLNFVELMSQSSSKKCVKEAVKKLRLKRCEAVDFLALLNSTARDMRIAARLTARQKRMRFALRVSAAEIVSESTASEPAQSELSLQGPKKYCARPGVQPH
eukprot:6202117-Pleurochrysis_carterae.AAC.1